MEIFYREKAFHTREKNQEKWLCPLRKIYLLHPWFDAYKKNGVDMTVCIGSVFQGVFRFDLERDLFWR